MTEYSRPHAYLLTRGFHPVTRLLSSTHMPVTKFASPVSICHLKSSFLFNNCKQKSNKYLTMKASQTHTYYLFSIQDAVFSTSLTDNSILSDQNLVLALTSLSHIPLPIHQQILFYIQIYPEPAHFVLLIVLPPWSKALSSHVWILTRDF